MKKLSFLLVIAITCSLSLLAKPAFRGPIIQTQEDGSTITTYLHGDEHFHWTTNTQGQWLQRDNQGTLRIIPALTEEQIAAKRMAAPRYATQTASPINLAPKGLILLVNFTDKTFTTPRQEIIDKITCDTFSRNYSYKYGSTTYHIQSKGSAKQYFHDVSFGKYNPTFDVVGPVTVSQKMSYYGGNDNSGNDKNPEKMIQEACKLAVDSVNFRDYDNDSDGYVDFVYVIYAGYGEADGGSENTIWPHSWDISSYRTKVDGVYLGSYACSNELSYYSKVQDGIGTFCHEFGHVLGLPDIYTTSEGTFKTSGEWDIMDYGCYNNDGNTPSSYSGYERFFLGWATPRVLSSYEEVTLHELQQSNEVLLISTTDQHNLKGNDPYPTTFYLLENRQTYGWDAFLPGHGMMLTKIAYSYSKWSNNEVNKSKSSLCVDIIEADGSAPSYSESKPNNGYFGKQKDLFPAGATSYTAISEHEILNIKENADSTISFQYKTPTPTENIQVSAQDIRAIFLPSGHSLPAAQWSQLPQGTYIIIREDGTTSTIHKP